MGPTPMRAAGGKDARGSRVTRAQSRRSPRATGNRRGAPEMEGCWWAFPQPPAIPSPPASPTGRTPQRPEGKGVWGRSSWRCGPHQARGTQDLRVIEGCHEPRAGTTQEANAPQVFRRCFSACSVSSVKACVLCVITRSAVSDSATPWAVACKAPAPGISRVRVLGWAAVSSSGGSSRPRDRVSASWISCAGGFFTTEPPGKPLSHGREPKEKCQGKGGECHRVFRKLPLSPTLPTASLPFIKGTYLTLQDRWHFMSIL